MFVASLSVLYLLFLSLPHEGTCTCSISTEISPPRATISSPFVQLYCVHDGNLDFVSFYLPDRTTLTHSQLPKYEIVNRDDEVVLIVSDIEAADAGDYQCNFNDEHENACFTVIDFEPEETINFCTPSDLTYHAYVGDSVTLECCVDNYDTQTWRDTATNNVIPASDHISYDGTHLVISPVTLDHRGGYSCIAQSDNNLLTIRASLEVYIRVSVTIDPPQTVVNVSDTAELTCTAHSYPRSDIVWAREDSMGLHIQDGVIEKREDPINSTTIQSTLTVFNVTEEDTGTYRCTAENINGSLPVTASLQLIGTPSAPLNVLLSIVNQTSIEVTWDPPEDDGHLPLLEYSVMWFTMESLDLSGLESEAVDGATTSYIITDLLPVTNYTVTIYAMNRRGKGKGSNEKQIMTEATVPGILLELLVSTDHLTASSVLIYYTLSNITGGSPLTQLRIVYQAGDEDSETVTTPITARPHQMMSYVLDGLKGNTPYSLRVSVGNKVGFGPEQQSSFTTLRPGYPATPTSVRATEVGAMRVKLSWEIMNIGRPFEEYSIRAIENGTQLEGREYRVKTEDVSRDGDIETVEISSLKAETCYVFTVTIENAKGPGFTSLPSDLTCTLSCSVGQCLKVQGIQEQEDGSSGPSSAQLIPILVVTVVVAIIVVLVVVLVAILSRRYSRNKSGLNIVSSTNQSFPNSSLTSSQLGSSINQSSSSLLYHHQHSLVSQNSGSVIDSEEAPATGSSVISDNPFYFGTSPQYQNGSPQYQNRQPQYQNGTIHSVSSYNGLPADHPQQLPGVRSYPLFPIPEHNIATSHFEMSPPAIPSRSRDAETGDTFMTDNPAFERAPDPLQDSSEEEIPPPIPLYPGHSRSDTDSSLLAPDIHVHPHFQNQHCHARIPPHSQSMQSVPFLGESFSQASRSPAMPRPPEFILPDGGELEEEEEEEEVEFMENGAYESVSPQPPGKELSSQNTSTSLTSETDDPSYYNMKPSAHSRGQSASPVCPQQCGSMQSIVSGSGLPRFEIAKQQERGLVFETVTIKSCV